MTKYSPSQLSTWQNCPRLWYITYILGERQPSTKAQALGSGVHAKLEAYLKGEVPELRADTLEGEIAMSGLPHLPPPGSGHVEKAFTTHISENVFFHGIIDYLYTDSDIALILDHKTTSDFRYMKSEEDLRGDTQGIIYAWSLCNPWPVWDTIHLRWIYYRTRGTPKSKVVDVTLSYKEILDKAVPLIQLAINLETLRKEIPKKRLKVMDLPPNPDFCSAYGGCRAKAHCKDLHGSLFDE